MKAKYRSSAFWIVVGMAFGILQFVGCGSTDDTSANAPAPDAASGDGATPTDASGLDSSAGDTSTSSDSGSGDAAKNYAVSTITAMRTAGTSGTFELDTVVLTYSLLAGAKAYVIDPAGGDFSAMQVICVAPQCTLASTIAGTMDGHDVSIKGTYTKADAAHGSAETFTPDTWIDDGAATTIPIVQDIPYASVVKSASTPARWFQKVSVTLADSLVMFDFTPAELAVSGATSCPYQTGFGLVPQTGSTALTTMQTCCGTATTAACATQATAQTATSASELLIGTDFVPSFAYTTDCRCASGSPTHIVPTSTSTVASAQSPEGILVYEVVAPSTTGFQYLAPTRSLELLLE